MEDSVLDYLSSQVGFDAAATVAAWWGGTRLYVPSEADPNHYIGRGAGEPALAALVDEWGGGYVWVSNPLHAAQAARNRHVAEQVQAGRTDEQIAEELHLTIRRIKQIKQKLAEDGLQGFPREKSSGKIRGENPQEKVG